MFSIKLEYLLIATLAVFAPIQGVLVVTGILIFADLVTGVMAARARAEKISSAGLRRTITKMFVYNTAIVMGFLVETHMTGTLIPMVKIVAGYIGLTEFLSILENLNTLGKGQLLKGLIEKLNSINAKKKE